MQWIAHCRCQTNTKFHLRFVDEQMRLSLNLWWLFNISYSISELTCTQCIRILAEVCTKETLEQTLLPALETLSKDPTASLRLSVIDTIYTILEYVDRENDDIIKKVLERLSDTEDKHVKKSANKALHFLAGKFWIRLNSAVRTRKISRASIPCLLKQMIIWRDFIWNN